MDFFMPFYQNTIFQQTQEVNMIKLKKLMVIMLTFAMSLSLVPEQTDAASKVKLNRNSLTLYVGNTSTLRVKNTPKKVKWSSSKMAVATVTQAGKVKAKKQGKCNITAKVAGKKYVCKVTVKRKASSTKKTATYVYITDTGSKYHRAGCRYLWNSRHKVKLSSAKSFGYTACSVCW